MPKKSYTKRDTTYENVLGDRYLIEARTVGILISTAEDGDMHSRSENAKDNYRRFFEKHGLDPETSFSPAIGLNYRIITIDEATEDKFTGQFIKNSNPRDEYHCDAVIVCGSNIPIAFRVGDCPVVLTVGKSFEDKTVVALIHAGRAELTAGVLKSTVDQMSSDYRMLLRSVTAYVFPHICKHCYKLERLDPDTKEKARGFWEFVGGYYHLDLSSWLKHQIEEAGIHRIVTAFYRCTAGISPVCVSRLLHDREGFRGLFSHFKSYHYGAPKGRFIVVVRIIEKSDDDDEEGEFREKI